MTKLALIKSGDFAALLETKAARAALGDGGHNFLATGKSNGNFVVDGSGHDTGNFTGELIASTCFHDLISSLNKKVGSRKRDGSSRLAFLQRTTAPWQESKHSFIALDACSIPV